MIRFGVQTPQEGLEYKTIRKIWLECQKLGFDSLWLYDHLIPIFYPVDASCLECWTTLSALASEVKGIKLGVLVLCNLIRNPTLVAKMAATLDQISNGRVQLGIGAGWNKRELVSYGIAFPNLSVRIEMLREAVQVIRKMWTEEIVIFHGKYYTVDEAVNYPKPVQKPHPPIWIGSFGEKLMLGVIAELADVWNFAGGITPEAYNIKRRVLEEHCMRIGRNPKDIENSWLVRTIVAKNENKVKKKILDFARTHPHRGTRNVSIEEYAAKRIIGTPDECIQKIRRYISVGIKYFILNFSDVKDVESLRLFSEHILPAFQKK